MGAAWYLPAWVEDTDLTIHSKPAFLLWLLYRGAGCNITPVAKRIVYFKERPPLGHSVHQAIQSEAGAHRPLPHQVPHRVMVQAPIYKFHSLSFSDGSNQVPSDWQMRPEVTVNYTTAIVPRRPEVTPPQYEGMCYTHVIPRTTPPHTVPLTAQDLAGRGCPGLGAPYETVSPARTVSMTTADGHQRPMVETQIYSVYPVGAAASPFRHDAPGGRSAATQTERRQLVSTEESLPVIEDAGGGVVADECVSHYWNAPESYPDLPSVQDFSVTSQHAAKRHVYNQASRDAGSAFRQAAYREGTSQGSISAGYASFFQMPMIYFYHY